jgi:competence protein ComEC
MRRALFYLFALLVGIDLCVWGLVLTHRSLAQEALYFFDVGQGDSEMITLSTGEHIIIDGGPTSAILKNLDRVLAPTDRRIDLIVMTHPQLDHFAGLIDVVRTYDVGAFIGSGRKADIGAYQTLHQELIRHNVPYVQVSEGDEIRVGDSVLSILSPNMSESLSGELNDSSVVVLLKTPRLSALYTGDIGENIEQRLVADYDVKADVLKVPHHGSRFSSSNIFVKEVDPKVAVIEVGARNTYGHPTQAALSRLASVADQILRTDMQGILKIVFKDGALQILNQR